MRFDQNHQNILDFSIGQILEAFPTPLATYVFGSFGTEFEIRTSDIDLAILCQQTVKSIDVWNLAQKLAIEFDQDVDIIDLRAASTVFRFQVLTTGKRIYCSDETACDFIENTYLSMYLSLNEARADIVKSYQENH